MTDLENVRIKSQEMTAKELTQTIHELAENGEDFDVIKVYLDSLDELVLDDTIKEVMIDAGIVECEKCGCQDLESTMTTRGNEDYSIRLCEHCGS